MVALMIVVLMIVALMMLCLDDGLGSWLAKVQVSAAFISSRPGYDLKDECPAIWFVPYLHV